MCNFNKKEKMMRKMLSEIKQLKRINVHDGITGLHDGVWGNFKDIKGDVSKIRGDVSGIVGSVSKIEGDVSNVRGDMSGIFGDVTVIRGNLDECGITQKDRIKGINIQDLIGATDETNA